jgi:serine/threonine protein kinase/tetratricopeptide (TPR) repeat protein/TolB-like protein
MPSNDSETMIIVDQTIISPDTDFGPRYRVEALVGEGGMGRVYKALDKELDRVVAIKVIRPTAMAGPDALRRFKQELVLASKISHKNILRIHDLSEVNGMKFITMAYVEGQDLQHIIRDEKPLPLDRICNLGMQMASALAAAHSEDVVHRDLKPQNILVDKNDQIYVSDFGLAKSFAEGAIAMTQTGAFLGTPRYMSPEQVEGKATDGRSDLYSFGLILYEMATGDVPFTGESALGVMYMRIREKPKSPKTLNPALPNWFVDIVMKCLEKEPENRYQHAEEILADLELNAPAAMSVSRSFSRNATRSMAGTKIAGNASINVSRMNQTIQIQLPAFTGFRWIWVGGGAVALLAITFAIPQVRHSIFHAGTKTPAAAPPVVLNSSGVPPVASGKFVAVLPLQIVGDANQVGYVAKGIEDSISAKLSQLKDVRVTPNDAADQADQKQPIDKIAHVLGANYVVQGQLQSSGEKIRVVMSMNDVADNKTVWNKQFDGVTGDLFTLEDQIYDQLVWGLNVNLTDDERTTAAARPTDNAAAYDLYLRGRNALRGHDAKSVHQSLDYFDQALKADGSFALAYTGVADADVRLNTIKADNSATEKALAAAQQAQQLNDKLPEVHATLGGVYRATGKYPEAVAELNRAITLAPSSDEFYRRLGDVYVDSGKISEAIDAYQKAVKLNPYYWANYNSLGKGYAHQGDFAKALEAYQKVVTLNPNIGSGYENVGNMYLQQGKYQESIPYYQKALQVEPFFGTYSNLGSCYFFLRQYAKAVEMFEKASELSPDDTQTMVNLADAYRGSGDQEKARASYQKAIALGFKELQTNPANAEVMSEMALSYAKIGNASEARKFIQQARGIDKNNVSYIYYQADIEALLGAPDAAMTALREALQKHYPAEYAADDQDLQNLRGPKTNQEFTSLIQQYSKKKTQ